MDEFDVQPELMNATLSPQEGSTNIEKSVVTGVQPDAFIDNKELDQNYESVKTQVKATAPVARKLSESRSIASVMKEEVPAWNNVTKIVDDIGKSVSGLVPETVTNHIDQRRVNILNGKRADGQLSKQEKYELIRLKARTQSYAKKNPGMSEGATTGQFVQGLGESVLGSGLDIGLSIIDNPVLAGTTIGIPTAIAAARGVPGGPISAAVSGTAGLVASTLSPTGLPLIQGVDQYKQMYGEITGELMDAKDASGNPLNIPINTVRGYGTAGALAGSLFEIVGMGKLIKDLPIAKRLGRGLFKKIAKDAALEQAGKTVAASAVERSIGQVIGQLARAAGTEGAQEGFQELTSQIAQAGGLSYSPIKKDTDLAGGISNLWDQYKASTATLLKEGKLTGKARDLALNILGGAVAGPAMSGGMTVATEGTVAVVNKVSAGRKARADAMKAKYQQDLTARINNRLAGMQMPLDGMPRQFTGAEGQQAKVVIEELVKATGETQLKQLQPAHADQLIADAAQQAGVPFVWLDPDDARAFADDPKKAADFRKMLGQKGEVAASKDSQVKVRLVDALNFTKKYSEASGMFSFTPESMSANEAMRRTEEMKTKQQEVLNRVSKNQPIADRPHIADLATTEQADQRLAEAQVKLEDLKNNNATPDLIQQQEQIIRDIEDRQAVLPSATEDQTTMDFTEQVARKKAREAQDINLPPDATQEQVDATFESREQAEAYWDRLDRQEQTQQIQDLKAKVEFTIASKPSEVDAVIQLQADVATGQDTYAPQRYNEQVVIPPEIRDSVPQAGRIETMAQEANKQYTDAVADAANREWVGVVNEQQRIAMTVEREIELENARKDPEIQVVDAFVNSKNLSAEDRATMGATKSKSKPAFAIDPESLTPSEKEQYLENPNMVARGVFDKKGMSVADVAELTGAQSSQDLLRILSEKPTTDEAVDAGVKTKEASVKSQVESSTPFNETAINKALNNKTRAAKSALEYYKNGDWSGFKKAIKAVVLPIPKVQDIRSQAEKNARQSQISDLNVAQYTKGEMRSRRKAADAVLRGDLQEAFIHKTNEIENIEAARATHKMQGEVNKRTNKVAKFFTPEVRAELEAAGPKFVDAVEDIMSSFNLSPYSRTNDKQGAFNKLVEDMANKGQGDLALPQDVTEAFDPRLGWDSMEAGDYIQVVDTMDNILALARQKNRTMMTYEGTMKNTLVSIIEAAGVRNLADHPDRNENRSEQEQPNSITQKIDATLGEMEALITNTNFAVQHLDRGKLDGFWGKIIVDRLKGINDFKGPWGLESGTEMRSQIRKNFIDNVKKYGVLKFRNMGSERINIKQFEGIKALNNGDLTKLDLWVMALNTGNQGNIDRLTNFGVSEEIIRQAVDDHLTNAEMDLAQGVWDIYASLEDRVVALEKMDGDDVELVPAKPFTFKGKEYRGGYHPIHFVTSNHEGLLGKVKSQVKDFFKKTEEGYSENYAARGMTSRGYTKNRVGSDQRVSLDARTVALGLEEIVTDLSMRVPVRDVYKILTNYNISREMINVLGKAKFNAMKDGISSLTTTETARRLNGQIQGEATLDNFFSSVESAAAVTTIAANVSSLMMQPLSVGNAIENMGGANGVKHILMTIAKTAAPWNWHRIPERYKLAVQINPSIKHATDNLEIKNAGGIADLLPTRRNYKGGKIVNMMADARKFGVDSMMSLFSIVDATIKTPVTLAAYEQYLKGEAPGHDGYKHWQMSPDEQHEAARSYAQRISESSLTHTTELDKANIQKTALGKRFSRYFNDLRNQLNTTIASTRQIKWSLNEGVKLAKEGNVEGSARAYMKAGDKALSMALVSITMAAYEAAFKSIGGADDEDKLTPEGIIYGAVKARTFGASPVLRELVFGLETGQAPGIPLTNIGGQINAGIEGLGVVLNNYTGLLDATEMDKELTDRQLKGMLSIGSYVTGGIPVNGPWKLVKAATDPDAKNVAPERVFLGTIRAFIDRAEKFIEKFKDDPKMKPITEAVKKDVSALKTGTNEPYEISNIDLAAFRNAENPTGQWDATNEKSQAFGDYQILESTWKKDIVKRAPKSLKLTELGLYDKDGKQAERGIKWYISDNARVLRNKGIEVNLENIYGAHHFGATGWAKVLNSDDSATIAEAFSVDAIKDNPWLTEKVSNVGEAKAFIKRYISNAKYKAIRESFKKTSVAKNP